MWLVSVVLCLNKLNLTDEDSYGAASRMRGMLLRVLCGEPRDKAVRLDDSRAARRYADGPWICYLHTSCPQAIAASYLHRLN